MPRDCIMESTMEINALVCMRVADIDPPVESFVDGCHRCKHAVWRAFSSPKHVDRVICVQCVEVDVANYKAAGETVIQVEPPTEEQLREVKKYFDPPC